MLENLKKFLDEKLPPAKYTDGKETKCLFYRTCNIFDISDD
jgi:hypothetical protein